VKSYFDRPFLALLLALLPSMVVYPLIYDHLDGRLLFNILFTLLFAAAFWVVFKQTNHRGLALLLGIPTLIGSWTSYALPDVPHLPVAICFHLIAAVFLAFTVVTILTVIYAQKVLTSDSIYGAFAGYFLIGMAFGHLYCVIDLLVPGSFQGPGDFATKLQDEAHQRFLLTYFSMVTLTTVGYGDVTPVTGPARGLAIVEAVTGQFFMAVVMAELIGIRIAQSTSTQDPAQK
jgi:hypothetical protein